MTDLRLQEAVASELEEHLLSDGIMMLRGREFKNIHVFRQDLPLKENGEEDPEDEEQWNYILVVLDDEDVKDDKWEVTIHFCIGIVDAEKNCQGNLNVAYLMDEIYSYFIKKGIVKNQYRMERKAHKRFNKELRYPYYEGDLITFWRLPLPFEEGLEEFL